MLAIAQAILTSPRYLVVDELSLGLAPVVVRRLAAALENVANAGTGVLLIEQFTAVALSIAQHAYVLAHGRVRFDDTATELEARPDVLQDAYLAGGRLVGDH
jgi:branched-chain amino acid transport system ATP-binding protein